MHLQILKSGHIRVGNHHVSHETIIVTLQGSRCNHLTMQLGFQIYATLCQCQKCAADRYNSQPMPCHTGSKTLGSCHEDKTTALHVRSFDLRRQQSTLVTASCELLRPMWYWAPFNSASLCTLKGCWLQQTALIMLLWIMSLRGLDDFSIKHCQETHFYRQKIIVYAVSCLRCFVDQMYKADQWDINRFWFCNSIGIRFRWTH